MGTMMIARPHNTVIAAEEALGRRRFLSSPVRRTPDRNRNHRGGTAGIFVTAAVITTLACWTGCAQQNGLFGPPPVSYEQKPWRFENSDGLELISRHYVLRTTFKDSDFVRALPAFLETCWDAYAQLLPATNEPAEPLQTYLFLERRDWEHFTEAFSPIRAPTYKLIRAGGYTERGVTASHHSGSKASTCSVLAHEGLHQYLDATHGKPIAAWLNEGLACYFEGFDLDAHNRPVFTPEKNFQRSGQLREAVVGGKAIPLSDILGTHAGIEVHKTSRHVRTCYAQWWALVLYLMQPPHKNPYHDAFRNMLRELGSEAMTRRTQAFLAADTDGRLTPGEAVFRAYISEDLERFQADYDRFVRELLQLTP